MDPKSLLTAFIVSVTFISWPIVGKYVGATPTWTVTLAVIGSLVGALALSAKPLVSEPLCSVRILGVLLVAGIINGVGCILYTNKCVNSSVNTGVFVMTVSVMGLILAPTLNFVLNKEALSARQMAGMAVAGIAVYLLKK